MVSENPINMASVAADLARQASPIEDAELVGRLEALAREPWFVGGTVSKLSAEAAQSIRVMREAAEIGLEYVIEASNQRKEKDAVFDNAMRDIERIESALGASGHD